MDVKDATKIIISNDTKNVAGELYLKTQFRMCPRRKSWTTVLMVATAAPFPKSRLSPTDSKHVMPTITMAKKI